MMRCLFITLVCLDIRVPDQHAASACGSYDSLLYTASPYLFPFVLEYSLIAVATMASLFGTVNIRITKDILDSVKKAIHQSMNTNKVADQHEEALFTKSHRGMYSGKILVC